MKTSEKINEELLTYSVVSRYEVINDYPGNCIDVGEIIELRRGPDKRFHSGKHIEPYAYTKNGAIMEYELKQYPHLYKKLV